MKKIVMLLVSVIAIVGLSGCNSGYDYYDDELTTLFLVDEAGNSYAGVPYKCDSMNEWSQTAPNGEFSFIVPDTCTFDFEGYNGVYGDEFDEVVRIVDYTNDGKGRIPYECTSFGVSSTYTDGSFDYDKDDVCSFYL